MKSKLICFLLALSLGAAALADFVYLRGDKVYSDHGALTESTTVIVPIKELGVPHRLIINTGNSARENYEVALSWSLETPDEVQLYSDNEMAPYRNRDFEFVPERTGDYVLSMSPNYTTAGVRNRLMQEDRFSLSILLNDRSFVIPLLQVLPF
ncbi:hypothetical protein [Marinobacter sp. ATCH36]|uniref:hypothetical protein n=1 Tax=Marinobacter sp. ATCH36 TaxID=2945106 RepID=UPI0020226A78|nr:hypothetical protein [Marinobacter sp. ATCH36]MCL7943949.1 hypothetical protein [Marinobacter sp. ATCH36]